MDILKANRMATDMLQNLADLLETVAENKIWSILLPDDNRERAFEEGKRFITTDHDEYRFGKW